MKKIVSVFIAILVSTFAFAQDNILGVSVDAPVLIASAAEMAAINNSAEARSGNYILTNDLILKDWIPIGTEEKPFYGTFDGNGYSITIQNFNVITSKDNNHSSTISVGLFGVTGKESVIKNLKVAGKLTYNSGDITLYMGAIAGSNHGIIYSCISAANIDAHGGLYNKKSGWEQFGQSLLVSSTQNKTVLIAYQNEACGGGIAGLNMYLIDNCYTTGDITVSGNGHKNAGGIAGRNGFGNGKGGVISHCYATGNISAKEDAATRQAGGITGMCMLGSVVNCLALNEKLETIGKSNGIGIGGLGVGYPTNMAFGVISFNVSSTYESSLTMPTHTAQGGGVGVYDANRIRNYGFNHMKDNLGKVKNAYFRHDMVVVMATDEEGDKKNIGNKKNILYPDRGKEVNFTLTQEQSWWNNDKHGVSFPFGSKEDSPWIWDNNLKRPVLFWETDEGKIQKRSAIDIHSYVAFKDKNAEPQNATNQQSSVAHVYFHYCGLDIMKEDLQGKYSWENANQSCPNGWRLPTIVELQCMCKNKSRLDNFNEKEYWSSTEKNDKKTFTVTLNDCEKESADKSSNNFVRCVRSK